MAENSKIASMPYIGTRALHSAVGAAIRDLEARLSGLTADQEAKYSTEAQAYFSTQRAEVIASISVLKALGQGIDDQVWDLVKAKHPSAEGGK